MSVRPMRPETIARRAVERAAARLERTLEALDRTADLAARDAANPSGFWPVMYRDELARYAAEDSPHYREALAAHLRRRS